VEAAAREFASFLKMNFTQEIARDPSAFKKSVVRMVRQQLPPRRGRPNDPQIDAALRMIDRGEHVKDVLRVQVLASINSTLTAAT